MAETLDETLSHAQALEDTPADSEAKVEAETLGDKLRDTKALFNMLADLLAESQAEKDADTPARLWTISVLRSDYNLASLPPPTHASQPALSSSNCGSQPAFPPVPSHCLVCHLASLPPP